MTHADRFWANIQNRRFARARQALAESPSKWRDLPVGRLDPKLHKESRTGPQANVTRKEPAQIVTSRKALDTYIKRIQKRVGFAKGTWIKAAKAIGGRVRGAAQWATRHRKAPGECHGEDRQQAVGHPHQPARLHGRRDDRNRHPARDGGRGGAGFGGRWPLRCGRSTSERSGGCVAVRLSIA